MADQADLFQDFLDSSDAVIYIKDKDGRFIMLNRRGAELLHMSVEEVIGKTAYDLFPRKEADRVMDMDRKVAETGAPHNFKDTLTLPSGQITLLDHKFPVTSESHPNAVGGIAIDITNIE